jgi:hypothetical protein
MKFDFKLFFKNNWQHFAVLGLFIAITIIYFSPAFSGYTLKQTDIQNYVGMSRETKEFKDVSGEHIGWTNSMFGGMPTAQISAKTDGNWTVWLSNIFSLGMPYITFAFIISMVTMYILLQTFKIKPFISAIGSIAYALTSYLIIVIKVGHSSKSFAMAYIPLVIAGFYILYRRNWKLGIIVSMIGMTLEIAVNHVQITYYLAIILLFIGIVELINAVKTKTVPDFAKKTGMLVGTYLVAVIVNFALLFGTLDYTKYSTRGQSELTISAKDDASDKTSGLDRSYIIDWSYGIQETWSIIIPDAKGGNTARLGNEKEIMKEVDAKFKGGNFPVGQNNKYWGDQSYVEGPVYIGVIVVFLFVLGMVYVKDKLKWGILAAVVLGMFLSWGGNFPGLTNFFIDNVPLYNKFRAVSMTLVILEFCLPFLAILFIKEMYEKPDEIKNNPKGFYIVSGVFGFIFLLFLASPTSILDFTSKAEGERQATFLKQVNDPANPTFSQMPQQQKDAIVKEFSDSQAELVNIRTGMFRSDLGRSFIFFLLAGGLIYLFVFRNVRSQLVVIGGLGALITIDLFSVDKRYLDNSKMEGNKKEYKSWTKKINLQYPFAPEQSEQIILQAETSQNPELAEALQNEEQSVQSFVKENELKGAEVNNYRFYRFFRVLNKMTHFRVHDYASGFNSGRSSYFYKTIGGYHGAKLKKYQEVWDFYFNPESKYLNQYTGQKVLDMLNTKYIIGIPQGQGQRVAQPNPETLGNAWLIQNIKYVPSADAEVLALGDSLWNPKATAIANEKFKGTLGENNYSGQGLVSLESYHPTNMVYKFNSQEDQFIVFSEIYYPENWKLTIDGQESEIINVNYILRGAKIPAGEHEIVMTYHNPKTNQYNNISKVGSGIFYVVLAGMIFLLVKDRKGNPIPSVESKEGNPKKKNE